MRYFPIVIIFTIIAIWQKAEALNECEKGTTKYFRSAELKKYPPFPTREESETWAKKQEEIGGAYYVANYCENGVIASLTKYLDKKVIFRYEYIYKGTKLVAVDTINNQGEKKRSK